MSLAVGFYRLGDFRGRRGASRVSLGALRTPVLRGEVFEERLGMVSTPLGLRHPHRQEDDDGGNQGYRGDDSKDAYRPCDPGEVIPHVIRRS